VAVIETPPHRKKKNAPAPEPASYVPANIRKDPLIGQYYTPKETRVDWFTSRVSKL
jgi:hypothetical protein